MSATLLSSRCTIFPFVHRYSRRVVLPSGRERARTCRTGHVGRRNSLVVLVDASRDKARAFVCGYDDVGKACVFAFRGSGAHVFVAECELLCALQACFKGVPASCLKSTSLFLSTGNFNMRFGPYEEIGEQCVLWKHWTLFATSLTLLPQRAWTARKTSTSSLMARTRPDVAHI